MNVPFQPGDVVVCVDDAAFTCSHGTTHLGFTIKRSAVVRVQSLSVSSCGCGTIKWDDRYMAQAMAERFRKIDADVTEDFREQLRKLPVRERAA